MHKSISYDMLLCMRTTLNLNDNLIRQAKVRAAQLGVTLTEVIESALRDKFKPADEPVSRRKVTLTVSSATGGLQPEFKGMLPSEILAELEDQDANF